MTEVESPWTDRPKWSPPKNDSSTNDDDDEMLDKELGSLIEKEEKQHKDIDNDTKDIDNDTKDDTTLENKQQHDNAPLIINDDSDDDELDKELEQIEKGQKETAESKEKSTDDEDSEPDDYHITEDQKRALEELNNQKVEFGIQDEEPPEYNVKERLKELNQELANDPTPVEKQGESRVGFKDNLIDLVAPPPDYDDDDEETPRNQNQNNSNPQVDNKELENSESMNSASSKDSSPKKDKVLIEREGKFELVNSDDVTARDLLMFEDNKENESDNEQSHNRQPVPPTKPRPSTANGTSSRRAMYPAKSQRAQSASVERGSALNNFSYDSPYGLSKRQKEVGAERKKALEKQRKEDEEKKKREEERKKEDSEDAFRFWLKQATERERKRRQMEQEQQKKNHRESKEEIRNKDGSKNTGMESYESLNTQDTEERENEEAYKNWLKTKQSQIRHEKLLHRRAEQEQQEGFYIRSRQECDKSFRKWLRKKYEESKKAKAEEKQRARLHRLSAKRSRKSRALVSAVRQSNAFRYVDYYGYRY